MRECTSRYQVAFQPLSSCIRLLNVNFLHHSKPGGGQNRHFGSVANSTHFRSDEFQPAWSTSEQSVQLDWLIPITFSCFCLENVLRYFNFFLATNTSYIIRVASTSQALTFLFTALKCQWDVSLSIKKLPRKDMGLVLPNELLTAWVPIFVVLRVDLISGFPIGVSESPKSYIGNEPKQAVLGTVGYKHSIVN